MAADGVVDNVSTLQLAMVVRAGSWCGELHALGTQGKRVRGHIFQTRGGTPKQ